MHELLLTIETFLEKSVWGLSYGEYLLVSVVLVTSFLITKFMPSILTLILHSFISKNEVRNKKVINAVSKPLRLIPLLVGGYVALYVLHPNEKLLILIHHILKSTLIGIFFWSIIAILRTSESVLKKLNIKVQPSMMAWMDMGIILLVSLFGIIIVIDIWGIPIAPIIGSLGVLGIGIGLAAKDLFSNLISGLLIMSEKRFVTGEWIQVKGIVEGTVEKINFRSTLVRLFDSSPTYVPNNLLADHAMINYSRMQNRRIYWMIGLKYTTPPKVLVQIREDTEHWIINNPKMCTPQERSLFVRIDSFGDSSINLMIYCFTKTTEWGQWLEIKESFAFALINIIKDAGSGLALPSRTLYFGEGGQPEAFNPLDAVKNKVTNTPEK